MLKLFCIVNLSNIVQDSNRISNQSQREAIVYRLILLIRLKYENLVVCSKAMRAKTKERN